MKYPKQVRIFGGMIHLSRSGAVFALALTCVFSSASQGAESMLPLDSLRGQGATDHCWAYSMAHALEARAQALTGTSVVLDVEQDLRYWVFYDRFFQRFKAKRPLDRNWPDSELLSETGMPVEFLDAFLAKGHAVRSVRSVSRRAGYEIGESVSSRLGFLDADSPDPGLPGIDIAGLLEKLRGAATDSQADRLIRAELDRSRFQRAEKSTRWKNEKVGLGEVPHRMFDRDFERMLADPLVWVQRESDDNHHRWEKYFGGKHLLFFASEEEQLELARQSLLKKMPAIATDETHGWTIIGFSENDFAYADSTDRGVISWADRFPSALLVHKSVLDSMLRTSERLEAHGAGSIPDRSDYPVRRLR